MSHDVEAKKTRLEKISVTNIWLFLIISFIRFFFIFYEHPLPIRYN